MIQIDANLAIDQNARSASEGPTPILQHRQSGIHSFADPAESGAFHVLEAKAQRPPLLVRLASGTMFLIGLAALFGWLFDLRALKSMLPGFATMKANTAIAFMFAGISLRFTKWREPGRWQTRLAQLAALGVILIGATTIAEYVFDRSFGIDELIIVNGGDSQQLAAHPGRPAPASAASILMLGLALLLLPTSGTAARRTVQFLAVAVLLISALALLGYWYGVESLYRIHPYNSMALHTAATLFIASIGILGSRTDFGLVAPLKSQSMGGMLARRLLPAMLVIPAVLGRLRLEGQQLGLYGLEFGMAFFTITNMVLVSTFVWLCARSLNQADQQRQLAAEQLAKHRNELAHALRVNTMGEMAAGIAHELNQPLSAISNFARGTVRRLKGGSGDRAELIAAVNSIADESKRASEIIRSIKSCLKKTDSRRSKLHIRTVIRAAVRIVTIQAQQNKIAINVNIAPELPEISADRIQLEQVLVNLLSNGIEALQGLSVAKEVTIEARAADKSGIEVIITDNGCGLPDQNGKSIFDAFFTTKPEGLGMGLAISRSMIEAHGGQLWAEANAQGGATFRFTIPVV
jgi:signal transduction histidine kinase